MPQSTLDLIKEHASSGSFSLTAGNTGTGYRYRITNRNTGGGISTLTGTYYFALDITFTWSMANARWVASFSGIEEQAPLNVNYGDNFTLEIRRADGAAAFQWDFDFDTTANVEDGDKVQIDSITIQLS